MDAVFRALADPTRRRLLDSLNAMPGQTLRELCEGLEMTRQSVSKHLDVLEAANLMTTVWHGREKLHYLNAAPISDVADRWISRYHRRRGLVLAGLKRSLEDPTMGKPEFVYVTYIRTTPEALWKALTDPSFTSRYWGATFETDWKDGSSYAQVQRGIRVADADQVVLVSDPPRRLSYKWLAVSPEQAAAFGWSDEYLARVEAEPRSRVTFDIEAQGKVVRLTVIHDGFEEGSAVLESVSGGWPLILANLKSLLETGETLVSMEPAASTR